VNAGFDLLELDRYTELHRFGRELIEIGADVAALQRELASAARDFASLTAQQQQRALELQDSLVATRLASLEALFSRLYRSTRELAERLGKRVELDFSGQDIEMDRAVQEAMAETLLHLLRNAVDHGIEPPAIRQATGKPEIATIRCSATRDGRDVTVTVEDDGAGIDPETVYQAAVERGLVPAGTRLSPAEKLDLIFWQGVSTRREVTDISGRGVGMDIVRQVATRLQGQVQVWSEPGRGTRITMRMPATIALARVLLVRTGGEIVAVPVSPNARIVRVTPQTQTEIGGAAALVLEDRLVPLWRLNELVGLPAVEQSPRRVPRALVLAGPRGHVALLVEDVLGQQDVLVRPLPRAMRRLPGASGVTVLADGTVALILNPVALTDVAPERHPTPAAPSPRPARRRTVLVVDDSLSIRRIVCAAFARAGWEAVPARDGEEALALLQRVCPDLLIVDLEMPRLDGFELTARVRRQPAWHNIPIAVLTSRSGEKHRQRAAELGVNAYLTKPCPDRELLATAEALVGNRTAIAEA
jgi:chemosensory pili system protein ChpA (sensor histidine kinase/response regulator)